MKEKHEVEEMMNNLPCGEPSKYRGMTYEEGIEEALRWVLGEIPDKEFTYHPDCKE